MKVQILSPGVEHIEEAGGNAHPLRIGGNGEQSFGGGLEENVVDEFAVEEGDGGDGLGQSEDHVEVLGGQQFGLPLLQPLGARQSLALGTVSVATGAIVGMRVLAVVAPFDDTAQLRSPAGLDGMHQAVLIRRHRVGLPVGGAVLSKDVGQLQGWLSAHFMARLLLAAAGLAGWSSLSRGLPPEGTPSGDQLGRHGGVAGGGIDSGVAQQYLDDAQVGAVLQQVRGKAVPQGMDGDPFGDAGTGGGFAACQL